jgi:hypothetical protein
MKGGTHFTGPLPNKERRDTHIGVQTDGRDLRSKQLKWDQGALYIHIPCFKEICSDIQKLMWEGGDSQTHRQHGDHINLFFFFFFKIRKVG